MRRMLTLVLGLLLALPLMVGCHLFNNSRNKDTNIPLPPTSPDQKPTVPALVNYLNNNARKVRSVQASLDIDAKQGRQSIGLSGALAAQKPRDFRMRGKVLGSPAVDIGSNNDRFWYWVSKANPPYVYHCSYKELATGKVTVPFPIETDMVLAGLGIAEYDPKAKYELKSNPPAGRTPGTIELIQETTSASGQQVKRITVFNSVLARAGEPQVLEHQLRDLKGTLICRAVVQKVEVDRGSWATIPSRLVIEWPSQTVSMKLSLSDIRVNGIDEGMAARMFTFNDLRGYQFFDLARDTMKPTSLNRASMHR